MINRFKIICYLILAIVFASCSFKQTTNYSPLSTQSPISENASLTLCKPPVPKAGKAALCGVLHSTYMEPSVIPGTAFYLMRATDTGVPAILTGPSVENGDIQGVSDEMGRIFADDIPPGNYYIVVWAPYNWILAVQSSEDLTPRLFALEPDRQHVLGIIYVPWP